MLLSLHAAAAAAPAARCDAAAATSSLSSRGAGVHLSRPERATRRQRAARLSTPRASGTEQPGTNPDGIDPMKGWGARDPTSSEIDSSFGAKTYFGEADTSHVVKIPETVKDLVGLSNRKYTGAAEQRVPLAFKDANLLRKQVLEWRISEGTAPLHIRRSWRVRDAQAGQELLKKVAAVWEAEGHAPKLAQAQGDEVVVELASAAGVTEADFIIAARIDELNLTALVAPARRARAWA